MNTCSNYEVVKCIECGRKFKRGTKKRLPGQLYYGIRRKNAVTCSKSCSRKHQLYQSSNDYRKRLGKITA